MEWKYQSAASPDAVTAEQIAVYALTERLSAVRNASLKAVLPGEKTRQALHVLADSAEFRSLLPDEDPATTAPDLAE